MSLSLKPQRHHCTDWLYDQRHHHIGDTLTCTCNRMYTLAEPSIRLLLTFWRGVHDGWAGHVWVRSRAAERQVRRFNRWLKREANRRGRAERRAMRKAGESWN